MKVLATKTSKAKTSTKTKAAEKPLKYSKQRLLKSTKYVNRQDALNALLKDGEKYSFAEVDEILEEFYKGGHK